MVFPDLPGCTAMGRTLDEALQHAMEAAGEWAQAVLCPRPRLLEALRDDQCVKAALADGAVLAVVPLIFESGKPARANISLEAGTLAGDRRGGGRAWIDALGVHCECGAGEDSAGT